MFWSVAVCFSPFWILETNATKDTPRTEMNAQIITDHPPVCRFERTFRLSEDRASMMDVRQDLLDWISSCQIGATVFFDFYETGVSYNSWAHFTSGGIYTCVFLVQFSTLASITFQILLCFSFVFLDVFLYCASFLLHFYHKYYERAYLSCQICHRLLHRILSVWTQVDFMWNVFRSYLSTVIENSVRDSEYGVNRLANFGGRVKWNVHWGGRNTMKCHYET